MTDIQRESTPVVVLGLGLSALGTVRSLGRAGLRPYLVCPNGDLSGLTRWVRGRVLRIPETDDPAVLAEALRGTSSPGRSSSPAPTSGRRSWRRSPQRRSTTFITSAPDPDVVRLLVDKERFAETVERLGVPYPRTLAVSEESDLTTLELDGLFLKPRQSQLFARRYHRKAFTFEGLEEAKSAYRLVADAGLGAILQEYIPGPPTSHYFVDGFVDRNGRIAALFARQRIRMFPLDFGNSTLMVSVGLDQVEGAVSSLNTLLTGIGYRGIFSAEFKRDERDGLFKILEVNTRPWWFIEFATLCGVNVALLAYQDALGLEVPEIREYALGERCLLLPQDVRAYRALRRSKSITLLPWLRSWLGARPTIFDKSDPLPALSLPIVIARRAARRF